VQQHVTDARNGGSPLATDDWFTKQLNLQNRTVRAASRITKLARSALIGHSQASVESPQMGHSSSQHAINPYNKIPRLERRRRYPVVDS